MRLPFLKHLLESVSALARPQRIVVLGSGSVLPTHPELGTGYDNVFALDPYDLALVKLVIGREKDLALVRALLRLNVLQPERLRQHYHEATLGEHEATVVGRNLHALLAENPTC